MFSNPKILGVTAVQSSRAYTGVNVWLGIERIMIYSVSGEVKFMSHHSQILGRGGLVGERSPYFCK
jgi:hypothetical protein